MKFCRQCGKTVAIFSNSDHELCSGCAAVKNGNEDRTVAETNGFEDLLTATVSVKGGKVVLESEEGLLLWSGGGDRPHSLKTILDRGSRILAIRTRKR